MRPRIGIIGGTGLYDVGAAEPLDVETPHGDVTLHLSKLGGSEAFFLARHGRGHATPPHQINHHAHIAALAAAHCDYVVAVNNVGSLRPELKPGTWVVAEDFIDFHRRGPFTFHEQRAVHVAFARPYCPTASDALAAAQKPALPRAVYAGVDGPRFETRHEVQAMREAGATIVGMTGVPEAILAHEKGLCYACLAFVGNAATGVGRPSDAKHIQAALAGQKRQVLRILESAVRKLPVKKSCGCARESRGAELALEVEAA